MWFWFVVQGAQGGDVACVAELVPALVVDVDALPAGAVDVWAEVSGDVAWRPRRDDTAPLVARAAVEASP